MINQNLGPTDTNKVDSHQHARFGQFSAFFFKNNIVPKAVYTWNNHNGIKREATQGRYDAGYQENPFIFCYKHKTKKWVQVKWK